MVTVLANLSGTRIDRVHERRPPDGIGCAISPAGPTLVLQGRIGHLLTRPVARLPK